MVSGWWPESGPDRAKGNLRPAARVRHFAEGHLGARRSGVELSRWVAVVVLAAAVAGCSAAPGAPAVSPRPYEQTFGPDYPAQPPAGQLTRVDDAAISADGRR